MPRKANPDDPDDADGAETLGGYPVGPPRTKQSIPSWVWIFVTVFFCIMAFVMGAVSYVYVGPDCPTEDITYVKFDGELALDTEDGIFRLSLLHRGGDTVELTDHRITVNGILLDGPPTFITGTGEIEDGHDTRIGVGEQAYWVMDNERTLMSDGEEYTVRVINNDSFNIIWEDDVLAVEEDL